MRNREQKWAMAGTSGHLWISDSVAAILFGKLNSANTGGCGGVVEERLQSFRQNFLFFGQRQYRQAPGRVSKGGISATEARQKDDRQMQQSYYSEERFGSIVVPFKRKKSDNVLSNFQKMALFGLRLKFRIVWW